LCRLKQKVLEDVVPVEVSNEFLVNDIVSCKAKNWPFMEIGMVSNIDLQGSLTESTTPVIRGGTEVTRCFRILPSK
jgi:hypothetical protein